MNLPLSHMKIKVYRPRIPLEWMAVPPNLIYEVSSHPCLISKVLFLCVCSKAEWQRLWCEGPSALLGFKLLQTRIHMG